MFSLWKLTDLTGFFLLVITVINRVGKLALKSFPFVFVC